MLPDASHVANELPGALREVSELRRADYEQRDDTEDEPEQGEERAVEGHRVSLRKNATDPHQRNEQFACFPSADPDRRLLAQ
jgi:hypothetical protein